jgi:hypothetical protein
VLTGEAVGLIRDVAPAGDILRRMVREAEVLIPNPHTSAITSSRSPGI